MLARQGILPKAVASLLLEAIAELDHSKILGARYDGGSEDLFFYIQHLLTESCGEDVAGRIHTARSRNDIDLTMYRMCLRQEILRITAETADARTVLLNLAAATRHTIMPANTNSHPPQPPKLVHTFLPPVSFLGAVWRAWAPPSPTINANPSG